MSGTTIGALFPGYLRTLGYAGFIPRSLDAALEKRAACAGEPVGKHMHPEHIDVGEDFSDTQLAEIFLHHRVLEIFGASELHQGFARVRVQPWRPRRDAGARIERSLLGINRDDDVPGHGQSPAEGLYGAGLTAVGLRSAGGAAGSSMSPRMSARITACSRLCAPSLRDALRTCV